MAKPPLESWKTAIPPSLSNRDPRKTRPPDAPDRCAVLRPWDFGTRRCGNLVVSHGKKMWKQMAKYGIKYGNMW